MNNTIITISELKKKTDIISKELEIYTNVLNNINKLNKKDYNNFKNSSTLKNLKNKTIDIITLDNIDKRDISSYLKFMISLNELYEKIYVTQKIKKEVIKKEEERRKREEIQKNTQNASQMQTNSGITQTAVSTQNSSVQPSTPTQAVKQTPPIQPASVENSLNYYIKEGKLPDNITKNEWLDIFKKNNINITDFNSPLSPSLFNRLYFSKDVLDAFEKKNIHNQLNESLETYKSILKDYKVVSNKLNGLKEQSYIGDTVSEIEKNKDEYEKNMKDIDLDSFDDVRIKSNQRKMDKIDLQLQQKYKTLEEKKSQLTQASYSNFKGTINKRIDRLEKQIQKLQEKQGYMYNKQTAIINKNNAKYIDKVTKKQQKYINKQQKDNEYADKMLDVEYDKRDFENRKSQTNSKVKTIYLNSRLGLLRVKRGACSLPNQIHRKVSVINEKINAEIGTNYSMYSR